MCQKAYKEAQEFFPCTCKNGGKCTIVPYKRGYLDNVFLLFVCLFVLRFYGPVNPMGSCRARSIYLTTRLLGRLSPLSG